MSEAEKLLDAAAELMRLDVQPGHRQGVLDNLEVAIRLAKLVESFPLDDEAEPAPVYRP
jgi:hypothetical protein